MPRKITEEKLRALRAQVQAAHHPLGTEQHALMQAQVQSLELHLASLPPLDAEALQAQLQQWQWQIEAEHPLLASVVRDALHKLQNMGI